MKSQTMRRLRQYHQYIALFFAPMILLFSLSGAFQTFRLQEAKGYGSTPPAGIAWIASVHKDQSLPREKRSPPETEKARKVALTTAANPRTAGPDRPFARVSPLPLKIFVVLMSIGLITSTLLGITIAVSNRAMRPRSITILVAGAVLPLLLLLV